MACKYIDSNGNEFTPAEIAKLAYDKGIDVSKYTNDITSEMADKINSDNADIAEKALVKLAKKEQDLGGESISDLLKYAGITVSDAKIGNAIKKAKAEKYNNQLPEKTRDFLSAGKARFSSMEGMSNDDIISEMTVKSNTKEDIFATSDKIINDIKSTGKNIVKVINEVFDNHDIDGFLRGRLLYNLIEEYRNQYTEALNDTTRTDADLAKMKAKLKEFESMLDEETTSNARFFSIFPPNPYRTIDNKTKEGLAEMVGNETKGEIIDKAKADFDKNFSMDNKEVFTQEEVDKIVANAIKEVKKENHAKTPQKAKAEAKSERANIIAQFLADAEAISKELKGQANDVGTVVLSRAVLLKYALPIAKTYIKEGIADVKIISKKLSEDLKSILGKEVSEESINEVIGMLDDDTKKSAKKLLASLKEKELPTTGPLAILAKKLQAEIASRRVKDKKESKVISVKDIFENINLLAEHYNDIQNIIAQMRDDINSNPSLNGSQKQEKLTEMENAFGGLNEKPLSDKTIEQLIRKTIKESNETISKLSAKNGNVVETTLDYLITDLKSNLTPELGDKIGKQIKDGYNRLLKKELDNILSKHIDKLGKPKVVRSIIVSATYKKAISLIQKGALNDEQFHQLMYEALGIEYMTEAERGVLKRFNDDMGRYDYGTPAYFRALQAMQRYMDDVIKSHTDKYTSLGIQLRAGNILRGVQNSLIGNMLTGVGTSTLSYLSMLTNTSWELTLSEISNGKIAPGGAGAFKSAINGKLPLAVPLFLKNVAVLASRTGKLLNDSDTKGVLSGQWKSGFSSRDAMLEANKKKDWYTPISEYNYEFSLSKPAKSALSSVMAFSLAGARTLAWTDQLNDLVARPELIAQAKYREMFANDAVTNSYTKTMVELMDKFKNDYSKALKVAKEHITSDIENGLDLHKKGDEVYYAYQLLADPMFGWGNAITEGIGISKEMSLQHESNTFFGELQKKANYPVLKLLFQNWFLRAGVNMADESLSFTPYGIIKGYVGRNYFLGKPGSKSTDRQRVRDIQKGMIGTTTTLLFGLALAALRSDDEDDEEAIGMRDILKCMNIKAFHGDSPSGKINFGKDKKDARVPNSVEFVTGGHLKFKDLGGIGMSLQVMVNAFDKFYIITKDIDGKEIKEINWLGLISACTVAPVIAITENLIGEQFGKTVNESNGSGLSATTRMVKTATPYYGSAQIKDVSAFIDYCAGTGAGLSDKDKNALPSIVIAQALTQDFPFIKSLTYKNEQYDCFGKKIYALKPGIITRSIDFIKGKTVDSKDDWKYDMMHRNGLSLSVDNQENLTIEDGTNLTANNLKLLQEYGHNVTEYKELIDKYNLTIAIELNKVLDGTFIDYQETDKEDIEKNFTYKEYLNSKDKTLEEKQKVVKAIKIEAKKRAIVTLDADIIKFEKSLKDERIKKILRQATYKHTIDASK